MKYREFLITTAIFCLALLPRVVGVQPSITSDEEKWVERAETFLDALQTGDYARTNQTGHPGVTTMWLGAAGVILAKTSVAQGWLPPAYLTHDYLYLLILRIPLGVVHALCIALAYILVRILFDTRVALLATCFWAMNPFIVAHAQLLHNDALLTSFMSLALLSALVAFRIGEQPDEQARHIRWSVLVGSGVAAGLAGLTKSPSAMLLPAVGTVALIAMLQQRRYALIGLLVWGGTAVGVWVLFWPSAWIDVAGSVQTVVDEVLKNGAEPHANGNFFMGQPVDDPGLFFYPVVLLFRLPPWTIISAAVSVGVGFSTWRQLRLAPPQLSSPTWQIIAWLWLFVGFFLLPMSILSKKFDRYILPIFPLLDLLAAVGMIGGWRLLRQHWMRQVGQQRWRMGEIAAASVGGLIVVGTIVWYHPYELAYYNPLAGGGEHAARVLLIGRGEGLEQVGAYIAHQDQQAASAMYDPCEQPIFALNASGLLEDFICGKVQNDLFFTTFPPRLRYIVLYINQVQRNPDILQTIQQTWGAIEPVYTVQQHGITYAQVYAPPHARFGEHVMLRDYALDTTAVREQEWMTVTLRLQAAMALAQASLLRLQLCNADGQQVVVQETTIEGGWQAGEQRKIVVPVPIALEQPAGEYTATVQIQSPVANTNAQSLPIIVGAARRDVIQDGDGEDMLLLEPIELPFAAYFGDSLHLSDYVLDTSSLPTTGGLRLFVQWKTYAKIDEQYMLVIRVFDAQQTPVAQVDVPLAGPDAPVQLWAVGEPMAYTHSIPLPPHAPTSRYWVTLGVYRPTDWSKLPVRGAEPPEGAPDAGAHMLVFPPAALEP